MIQNRITLYIVKSFSINCNFILFTISITASFTLFRLFFDSAFFLLDSFCRRIGCLILYFYFWLHILLFYIFLFIFTSLLKNFSLFQICVYDIFSCRNFYFQFSRSFRQGLFFIQNIINQFTSSLNLKIAYLLRNRMIFTH